jgi:regulatory protein
MTRPITYARLRNIALFYLERYDTSSGKLIDTLKRRVQKTKLQGLEIPQETNQWIKKIVQECQQLGYVDDKRYAENQVRTLSAQGKSSRFIAQKLAAAKISSDIIQVLLDPTDDLERAQTFVRKKHLGNDYQKDLAKLARAGFSYEIAKQVLQEDPDV